MSQLSGVKFFQQELNFLDLYNREYSGELRLTASSLATFILFHFYCDEFGRIREDELVLKHMSNKYQLPYCSIHKGYHHLFDMGLLQRNVKNGKAYITITKYANNNTPDQEGKMNYFIIPHHLLQSGVLNDFIRARDVSGILGLLHVLNSLSREHTRRNKKSIPLKVETLLKKMGKTPRNITDWMNRLILLIKPTEEKKAAHRFLKDKLFSFTFVDECYEHTEYDQQKAVLRATLRKELQAALTSIPVPYTGGDVRDAFRSLQQDCLDTFYPMTNIAGEGLRELRLLIHETIHKAVYVLTNREGEKIGNFGGFFRTIIRPILKTQYEELHTNFKVELKKEALLTKIPLPAFLSAEQTLA